MMENENRDGSDIEEHFVDAMETLNIENATQKNNPTTETNKFEDTCVPEGYSSTLSQQETNVLMQQDGSHSESSESEDTDDNNTKGDTPEEISVNWASEEPDGAKGGESNASGDKLNEKEIVIDEEFIRQKEAMLTEEEREARRKEAQDLKEKGNTHFKESNFTEAVENFTSALTVCPLCYAKERSIMYSNRAACKFRMELFEACVGDCSKALELNPLYLKALLRRAESYERTDKLDDALEDYTKVLEMDPGLHKAREACMRLPDQIKERNEKLKEEMMGKLKDLGNMILRPFGLSTNNFQLQQNEAGGYSVNFSQNPNPTNGNK